MLKGPLGEAFPNTIVCTTGQERNVHSLHGNTHNGQFLAVSTALIDNVHYNIILVRSFPASSSLLTVRLTKMSLKHANAKKLLDPIATCNK